MTHMTPREAIEWLEERRNLLLCREIDGTASLGQLQEIDNLAAIVTLIQEMEDALSGAVRLIELADDDDDCLTQCPEYERAAAFFYKDGDK
jgi:hypothetical protein